MSVGLQSARPRVASYASPRRAASAAAARLPLPLALIIHLMIFGSLFSGLPGPAALGELRGEGAVVGALALVLWSAASGALADVRGIRAALLYAPFLICIALGFAANADVISGAHFLGREGGEKFVASLLVVVLYLAAFFATCCEARIYGGLALLRCAGNAALWCGVLTLGEMATEVVSWFVPPMREAWMQVRGLWVSAGSSAPLFRLVGFAPEPSFGAISTMGLLGLLGCDWAIRGATGELTPRRRRTLIIVIGALFALELVLGNARTFAISVFGAVLAGALTTRLARRVPAALRSAALLLLPLPAEALLIWTVLRQDPVARSASNISRSVGMLTGGRIWADNPLLGVGLGQYGFHFRGWVPSWGLGSYEISRYFRDDQRDLLAGLPPSFSMFTRVGAELGLLGFLAWLLPPFIALRSGLLRAPSRLTTVVICALCAQIWVGLAFDSYRNIYYWWWLALLLSWPSENWRPPVGAPRHWTELRNVRQPRRAPDDGR